VAKTVRIPVLGQSVEEVRIVRWLKGVGDRIEAGQPIAEVETDKTNIEWESPESGTLLQILIPAGEYASVEAPALVVGEPGETVVADLSPADPTDSAPVSVPSSSGGGSSTPAGAVAAVAVAGDRVGAGGRLSPRARAAANRLGVQSAELENVAGSGAKGRVVEKDILDLAAARPVAGKSAPVSPLAKAIAGSEGTDLSGLQGSGGGGRILAADVRSAAPPSPQQAVHTGPGETRIPIAGLRKRIADNLSKSVREKPHVTLNTKVDMTETMQLRKVLLPRIEHETGVRLSPTDLIVWAAGRALIACPWMNGHVFDDAMVLFDQANVGLAVSLGTEGLVVPVLRDVANSRLGQLAAERARVVELARTGKLSPADLSGATFAVTNLGNYGIESFDPIIPPPQIAILGVCTIRDEMVVRDGNPVVRPMMGLSLSFDHRAVDGAPAAEFLQKLVSILENPVAELA
jgi:pyruvate dehydrogenase E2 component (dihydrolipoamide acetyltransferase)